MISMNMRFDVPFDLEIIFLHKVDDLISGIISDAARSVINVEHAINDGAGFGRRVLHNIGHGVCGLIKESRDFRFAAHVWFEGQGIHHRAPVVTVTSGFCQ